MTRQGKISTVIHGGNILVQFWAHDIYHHLEYLMWGYIWAHVFLPLSLSFLSVVWSVGLSFYVCLFVCPSVRLSVCMHVCLLSMSVCLSVSLLSVCQVHIKILNIWHEFGMFEHKFSFLFLCLVPSLFDSVSVCLPPSSMTHIFVSIVKQINVVASFFFFFELEIIANLVATWFHKNWKLNIVVNVKFTILQQFNCP